MVKSATASVIKESSKLDLHQWLSGGRPRTKTVRISNNPDLAERMDAVAVRMNELADQINAAEDGEPSGGIADDDPRDEWAALKAEYDALQTEYEDSLLSFTLREQKPTDLEEVKAAMKSGKIDTSAENLSVALVAHTLIDPVVTYQDLRDMLTALGTTAFFVLNDAFVELSRKRKAPTAPLSLRP